MPKVVYSPSKGLHQQPGSGFEISGVPVLEQVEALVDPAAADLLQQYGVTTISDTGASAGKLKHDNVAAGTRKVITKIVSAATFTLTFEPAGVRVDGSTASNTVTFDAVGETIVCVSNGSAWVTVHKAGATEAT